MTDMHIDHDEFLKYGVQEDDIRYLDSNALADLQSAVRTLLTTLRPEGVKQWMTQPNGYLEGHIPRVLMADEKEASRVREAAEAYARGTYL
jgi:hypothetical protein